MARRGGFSFFGFESTTETTLLNQTALSCQHFTGSLIFAEDGTGAAATAQRIGLHRERVVLNALTKDAALPADPPQADWASGDPSTIGPSRTGISGKADPP
jgi:hypothetical protein